MVADEPLLVYLPHKICVLLLSELPLKWICDSDVQENSAKFRVKMWQGKAKYELDLLVKFCRGEVMYGLDLGSLN